MAKITPIVFCIIDEIRTHSPYGISKHKIITIVVLLSLLSGCSTLDSLGTGSPTATETTTKNTPEPTTTPVETDTPTPTETATQTPTYSKKDKYGYFRDGYIGGLREADVNIINDSIDENNNTLRLTYEMEDPKTDNHVVNERENVSLRYVAAVDFYLNGNISELDESWIPKRVNVTAITPEGERYETAYTTLERAKEMIDGEMSARRYLIEYYGTIEPGPANPEYEG